MPEHESDAHIRAALRALLSRARGRPPAGDDEARLDYLERDIREVRTRVNTLFFAVLAVALGELIMKLVVA
jgi:hypothetical protein